jgi:hypothetical protein
MDYGNRCHTRPANACDAFAAPGDAGIAGVVRLVRIAPSGPARRAPMTASPAGVAGASVPRGGDCGQDVPFVLPSVITVTYGRRGARLAKREERAYREYARDEQRSQPGWIGGHT